MEDISSVQRYLLGAENWKSGVEGYCSFDAEHCEYSNSRSSISEALAAIYVDIPLDASMQEVRLLHLAPDLDDGLVVASLSKVSLTEQPEYHAISYAWGDPNVTRSMLLKAPNVDPCGGSLLIKIEVTTNLEAALRQFRTGEDTCVLWADALCINQHDLTEKSSQVEIMDLVYKHSLKTLVWLGDGTDGGETALNLMREIAYSSVEVATREENAKAWHAISKVIMAPWWKRVWIVQEFVLSPSEALFYCGAASLPYFAMYVFTERCKKEDMYVRFPQLMGSCGFYWFNRLRVALVKRGSWIWALISTSNALASDPRDRLYALKGLSDEHIPLAPDYSTPAAEVYTNFMRSILRTNEKALDLLCFRKPVVLENLPSWVPDFSSYASMNSAMSREITSDYNAHAGLKQVVSFSEDGKGLNLEGLWFDSIHFIIMDFSLKVNRRSDCMRADAFVNTFSGYQDWPCDAYTSLNRAVSVLNLLLGPAGSEEPARNSELLPLWESYVHESQIQVPETFQVEVPQGEQDPEKYRRLRYLLPLISALYGAGLEERAMFVTRKGFIGIGVSELKVNDEIIVALGCKNPLILRKEESCYRLVGLCYIEAIMSGEWINANSECGNLNANAASTYSIR